MIDQEMKEQLKEVFKKLESSVILTLKKSSHQDRLQLKQMLEDVVSCSERLKIIDSTEQSLWPEFSLSQEGMASRVSFVGIPGGHEFTSLIVALLNADLKGKMPDQTIQKRIASLKGPVRLKTYIALTCETCPDIVQALNQMAFIHPNFEHQMIDGAYVQEQVQALGLQGVPSIVHGEVLVHSGRITFVDLLAKLESYFGVEQKLNLKSESQLDAPQDFGHFDVVVVGGGPAGASAAIYSARKGLKTALIAERFGGQVQDTKGIENLISVPYTEGPQLAAQLNQHVSAYPVQILEHRRVQKIGQASSSSVRVIELEGGERLRASSIIVATGAKWRELGVPGEKNYIGRGVAFCPHCDGPYYKGKKVAVVGGGNSGVEAAIDLAGIVREVVLIEFAADLKADKVLVDKLLSLPNVSVLTNAKTEEVLGDGQKVYALKYQDRASEQSHQVDLDGVFVQIGLLPNSQFIKDVVETTRFGEIVIDDHCRTTAPGIYAAGDVTTTPYKQIIISMGEGAKAALSSFEDRMRSAVTR